MNVSTSRAARTEYRRTLKNTGNDTGGQVVAGSNPVSPTGITAGERYFSLEASKGM